MMSQGEKSWGDFFPIYCASRLELRYIYVVLLPLQVSIKPRAQSKTTEQRPGLFLDQVDKRGGQERKLSVGRRKCIKSCFMEQDSIFIICQEHIYLVHIYLAKPWKKSNDMSIFLNYNTYVRKSIYLEFIVFEIIPIYMIHMLYSRFANCSNQQCHYFLFHDFDILYLHFWMSEYYTFT